ncbi:hypothetical protein ATO6_17090 [Oceanicola sp. 22II-s10i]|uniref:hypothetical protein n=1 Tax=Oceanicola sp. 22II-s10i TaxID=1317116 RepID=UPI000B523C10|nr:hypothetical protein [Oceanicola sp. 22II-s10i]OWU83585.1 hypothetical protein ATO6_17090 [Oceanicola sp. 22II-s10i]
MTRFPRLLPALAVLTLLGACLPYSLYYRAGATTDRARADEVACGRIALSQAPVAIEREWIPGEVYRGRPICDDKGRCRPGPVRRSPPQLYERDVNEELRGMIARQCMADRGYQRVTLPACSEAVSKAVTPGITRTMPRINGKACVIRRGGDNYQIVPIAG